MRTRLRLRGTLCLALGSLASVTAAAQSTQSLIQGHVLDSLSGQPIAGAVITVSGAATNTTTAASSDTRGRFHIPLLSPGTYRIRVEAEDYQAQQIDELPLPVGAALDRQFLLRPLREVLERGYERSVLVRPGVILPYFGPDAQSGLTLRLNVDLGEIRAIETGMSYSIDPIQLRDLPLAGRDVYALLVTVPGVASDAANGRGLGLSVNGQRPTSSNFLLDGLENNNYLIAGPLVTMAPEAVQEYRVTTNNFAAEFGGTSGFIANTVSIPGGSRWHGLGYLYTRNDSLNANEFRRNLNGAPRRELSEWQPGASLGGPVKKDRLFVSAAAEFLHYRSFDDETRIILPTTRFSPTGEFASGLWRDFGIPSVSEGTGIATPVTVASPASINRILVLPRVDYLSKHVNQRVIVSMPFSRLKRPDFIWSPYSDFSSPLTQRSFGPRVNYLASPRPDLTLEGRVAISTEELRFDRAHPEIPTLIVGNRTLLPGSPAFYSFKNHGQSQEFLGNFVWTPAKHVLKGGGGGLFRTVDGYLTAGRDGSYFYEQLTDFGTDNPFQIRVALDRMVLNERYTLPNYAREYQSPSGYGFVQDSFRVSRQLVLNGGVRLEYLGAPRIAGNSSELLLALPAASTWEERFAGATFVSGSPGQLLYSTRQFHVSPRIGFAYAVTKNGRTLIRGSTGVFFDRPYDNLWQNVRNNGFVLSTKNDIVFRPQRDVSGLLPEALGRLDPDRIFSRLTLFADRIDAAHAYNSTLSVEHQFSAESTMEVAYFGSLGRNLIVTDQVNRPVRLDAGRIIMQPFRQDLPRVWYRSSDGSSDYHALVTSLRLRARQWQGRISYTWSHAQDIQSEPLRGDFFDLGFTRAGFSPAIDATASFSQQFEPAGERANSEFDQRHNLSYWILWQPDAILQSNKWAPLFRNWRVSVLGSVRSGFPFTVFQLSGAGTVDNRRADLVQPNAAYASQESRPGGVQFLNPAAFQLSPNERQGTSGRNAFRAPSYSSLDLSVARGFALQRLGESTMLVLRVDAFNLLNHANLSTPVNVVGPNFGISIYGRGGKAAVFPALTPFTETPRQIQLMLRLQF